MHKPVLLKQRITGLLEQSPSDNGTPSWGVQLNQALYLTKEDNPINHQIHPTWIGVVVDAVVDENEEIIHLQPANVNTERNRHG